MTATTFRAPGSYAGLTERQAELLSMLRYREAGGITPSFEEMRQHIGFVSKSNVHRIIDALVERGYVTRLYGKARSIRCVSSLSFDGVTTDELIAELSRRGVAIGAVERRV